MITEVTILVFKSDSEAIIRKCVTILKIKWLNICFILLGTRCYSFFIKFLFKERDSEASSEYSLILIFVLVFAVQPH